MRLDSAHHEVDLLAPRQMSQFLKHETSVEWHVGPRVQFAYRPLRRRRVTGVGNKYIPPKEDDLERAAEKIGAFAGS